MPLRHFTVITDAATPSLPDMAVRDDAFRLFSLRCCLLMRYALLFDYHALLPLRCRHLLMPPCLFFMLPPMMRTPYRYATLLMFFHAMLLMRLSDADAAMMPPCRAPCAAMFLLLSPLPLLHAISAMLMFYHYFAIFIANACTFRCRHIRRYAYAIDYAPLMPRAASLI